MNALAALLRDDSGASMTEYAIVLGLFTLGAIVTLAALSKNANGTYNTMTSQMQNFQMGAPP